jgi:restriction system protein
MYEIRIKDDRIPAYRVIKAETRQDADAKANAQKMIWEARWKRMQASHLLRTSREIRMGRMIDGKDQAAALTEQMRTAIEELDHLLLNGCNEPRCTWDTLKDKELFLVPTPEPPPPPKQPTEPAKWIEQPVPDLLLVQMPVLTEPKLTIMDRLIPGRAKAIAKEAESHYGHKKRLAESEQTNNLDRRNNLIRQQLEAKAVHDRAVAAYNTERNRLEDLSAKAKTTYTLRVNEWQKAKAAYRETQREQHVFIDRLALAYAEGSTEAIEYLSSEALTRSSLPESFPQGFELRFEAESRVLVIDYELPNQTALPKFKEVKFIAARSELQYVAVTETWKRATYDKVLYQMALRTINRILSSDTIPHILSVVFNGWVRSIDLATGAEAHGCILSLQAGRDEFTCLDLKRVDPKACFKSLKGVASSRLADLTPVRPVAMLNMEDPRFIEGYAVADSIDDSVNLAAMDWQDFENLIREVFGREFSRNGGEVKITQTSRDGGVDAVAFDPDPLRGGKIIIQAKRYTHTVGVSAVRDLYGTVQHEGAMKGILVTTATFGTDAYTFARDKPLTLISGAELLSMLERHGTKARINLAEARASTSNQ